MKNKMTKKYAIAALTLALGLSAAAVAQPLLRDAPGPPAFEFSLFGGFGLSRIKGTTSYQDQWSYDLLRSVAEKTDIATNAKTGFAGGGSLAYFFSPNFGLQASFSHMKADLPNTAVCNFNWTWTDDTAFSKTATWPGTGSFSSLPFSLDLVARFGFRSFEALLSAGATMFVNMFEQNSFFGYGITTIWPNPDATFTQYVDALKVGLEIPRGTLKRTAFGANFGAGFTIRVSGLVGLRAEARWFLCPEQTLSWNFLPGNYDGAFSADIENEPFSAADVQMLRDSGQKFPMTVNPSFLQIGLGLVFRFGDLR